MVGLSVALGLLQAGQKVTVLDGEDGDFRASQGNFGLVWLQGKGANYAPYAKLSYLAVQQWSQLASLLKDLSGLDVSLDQSGGFEFFTDPAEFDEFKDQLKSQHDHLGGQVSHDVLTGEELRKMHPEIGQDVVGATFCAHDGHVNPLRLLGSLQRAVTNLGGQIISGMTVSNVASITGGGFSLSTMAGNTFYADRVVLCAGLGSAKLAPQLGFKSVVRPQRGELLITEKLGSRIPFLSSTIRQVDEGGVQIGGTKADTGYDNSETLEVMCGLAKHAVAVLPALADVRVIRAWGALRVLSPDGYPVYTQSPEKPGAYMVTCHSGVTLAPFHVSGLVDWIQNASNAPDLGAFDEARFAV